MWKQELKYYEFVELGLCLIFAFFKLQHSKKQILVTVFQTLLYTVGDSY